MKQITLNIPDGEFEFFMKLVAKFKYKASQTDEFEIPEEIKKLVDYRRKTAKPKDYVTVAQSNVKLKKKYGF